MITQIIISWFLTQATISSMLADWFFVKHTTIHNGCHLYKGNAHNLFGNVCDNDITDLISATTTLQVLISLNLVMTIVLFFTTIAASQLKFFKIVTSLVISVISVIVSVIWHTTVKNTSVLPTNDINYFGVGWYLQVATALFALSFCGVVLRSSRH